MINRVFWVWHAQRNKGRHYLGDPATSTYTHAAESDWKGVQIKSELLVYLGIFDPFVYKMIWLWLHFFRTMLCCQHNRCMDCAERFLLVNKMHWWMRWMADIQRAGRSHEWPGFCVQASLWLAFFGIFCCFCLLMFFKNIQRKTENKKKQLVRSDLYLKRPQDWMQSYFEQ